MDVATFLELLFIAINETIIDVIENFVIDSKQVYIYITNESNNVNRYGR